MRGLGGIACVLLLCASASAGVLYVGPSGDHATIQGALNAALPGDEIIVVPGTYHENLVISKVSIVLRSTDPENASVRAITIIDGGAALPVMRFSSQAAEDFVIEGFTIRNGQGVDSSDGYGGGICGYGAAPTIRFNTITANIAGGDAAAGGGLHDCDGPIHNNFIAANSVGVANGQGGGLYGCDGEIHDNIISGNSSGTGSSRGGGLADCDGLIYNNTIAENTAGGDAGEGGGLHGCDGEIYDNTIRDNIAGDDAGLGGGLAYCDAEIYNNTITGNTAGYSGGQGGGLYACDGPIRNNTISDNQAFGVEYDADLDICVGQPAQGGGLAACNGTIEDNLISENYAAGSGGGLANCGGLITGNDIMSNWAEGCEYKVCDLLGGCCREGEYPYGGGLYGCDGVIEKNTISFNELSVFVGSGAEYNRCRDFEPSGGGLFLCGGEIAENTVSHNVVNNQGSGGGFSACNGLIRDSLIQGNTADQGGGLKGCGGTIERNDIRANEALAGGGLYGCAGVIQYNDIRENEALLGGGLCSCGLVQHNKIHRNRAIGPLPSGGGACGCSILQHNVIYGNEALSTVQPGLGRGGGVSGSGACCGTTTHVIRNCIIWGNDADMGNQVYGIPAPTYCCVQDGIFGGLFGGVGNVIADPLMTDPENGDFHIQVDSSCIDTGMRIPDVLEDFEGHPRPFDALVPTLGDGSDYDIGLDEWHEFTLTMTIEGNGLTDPPEGNSPQPQWEAVTVTAFPLLDWVFDYWEGDLTGSDNPATIVMDGDKSVTAVFRPISKNSIRLMTSVRGKGGLDPRDGLLPLAVGGAVTLTAYPEVGWQFDHWEGAAMGNQNPLAVRLKNSASLTAVFTKTRATDVNRDRALDAIDVQLAVLAASGFEIVPYVGDVNNDLSINTVDVQNVINAVLATGATSEYGL